MAYRIRTDALSKIYKISSSADAGFINEHIAEYCLLRQHKKNMKKDNEKRLKLGLPVAKFDVETKRAYLMYPDGRKVYAD